MYEKREKKQHSNLINDNTSIKYVLQYLSQNQVFIIAALLYPVGQLTLQSLHILISYLAINAPMRMRLYNRLTTWQFL